ncbi:MrcB family domain-containing protein [Dactylosporangium sp. McL0621]|uniref:MrcB family domain-containing protein n=1 Tax=Dactylosporangium sp. McL0621 TaxID=3415678 RepID=UPI003CF78961
MQDLIEEVLRLQDEYDAKNTPAMQRRGVVVRQEMRAWLSQFAGDLINEVADVFEDLRIQGRDGTGQKTEVPWIRLYSAARSPSATEGWYVVYLFSALGHRCYLTLLHSSTEWDGVEFRLRPPSQLHALVQWARSHLMTFAQQRADLVTSLQLDSRRSGLGAAYAASTVYAIEYQAGAVPGPDQLLADLKFMLNMLKELYRLKESDPRIPGTDPPEVSQLKADVAVAAGRRGSPSGQGFRLTKKEQLAVERRAVDVAMQYYRDRGWADVTDVGATESFDVRVRNGVDELSIEVKGTTSLGESVILTRNEVELHRKRFPHNALFIVHSIALDRSGPDPIASGGLAVEHRPWAISDADLRVLAFQYRVPVM